MWNTWYKYFGMLPVWFFLGVLDFKRTHAQEKSVRPWTFQWNVEQLHQQVHNTLQMHHTILIRTVHESSRSHIVYTLSSSGKQYMNNMHQSDWGTPMLTKSPQQPWKGFRNKISYYLLRKIFYIFSGWVQISQSILATHHTLEEREKLFGYTAVRLNRFCNAFTRPT